MVMNLPTNVKNTAVESSDSEEEVPHRKERNLIEELKRKSNHSRFQLKEINNDLVLQKYEDLLRSEDVGEQGEYEVVEKNVEEEDGEEEEMEK